MQEVSTKPYMIRAIYDWCTDNGRSPYISIKVGKYASVPREYINEDGGITFDISSEAVKNLKIDNKAVSFSARFSGMAYEVYFPIENIVAIYEAGGKEGLGFEFSEPNVVEETTNLQEIRKKPTLTRIK